MPQHKNLTGSDLHEPKGADSATANQVLQSTGSGATVWGLVEKDNISTLSVKNLNKETVTLAVPSVASAFNYYIPVSSDKKLVKVSSCVGGTVTGANSVITIEKGSGTIATLTISNGSTAGTYDEVTLATDNIFADESFVKVSSSATGVTSAVNVVFVFEFELL